MTREIWQDRNHPLNAVMKTAVKNIRKLSKDEAIALLESRVKWHTKINKTQQTRDLTGGFWSQSLDNVVWREVGKQAGFIKR